MSEAVPANVMLVPALKMAPLAGDVMAIVGVVLVPLPWRVTTTVYVSVRPNAVAATVIVFGPVARAIGALGVPEAVTVPLILMVAPNQTGTAVTVIDDTVEGTLAV
jgi:hypothetical protein